MKLDESQGKNGLVVLKRKKCGFRPQSHHPKATRVVERETERKREIRKWSALSLAHCCVCLVTTKVYLLVARTRSHALDL